MRADGAAALHFWARRAAARRHATLTTEQRVVRAVAQQAQAQVEQTVNALDDARSRCVLLMEAASTSQWARAVLGAWRRLVADERRGAAAAAAAALEAAAAAQRQRQREEAEEAIARAAGEVRAAEAYAEQSERRVEGAERRAAVAAEEAAAAASDLRERLAASEMRAAAEEERAARAEGAMVRLEEELQAAELRALWNKEQAEQEAELIRERLQETLVASPIKRPGGSSRRAPLPAHGAPAPALDVVRGAAGAEPAPTEHVDAAAARAAAAVHAMSLELRRELSPSQ